MVKDVYGPVLNLRDLVWAIRKHCSASTEGSHKQITYLYRCAEEHENMS